jgi:hypothetical protein
MMANPEIDYLRKALRFDPSTGQFIHLQTGSGHKTGKIAGTRMRQPGKWTTYVQIQLKGKAYKAHRLAWLFSTGEWPTGCLDHIDGDGTNNRIANLRLATNSLNMANRRKNVNSKSPYKGVRFVSKMKTRPWCARIQKDKRRVEVGYFSTAEEAFAAYQQAALTQFGDYARFE